LRANPQLKNGRDAVFEQPRGKKPGAVRKKLNSSKFHRKMENLAVKY
jgi:hypothetical protein